MLEPRAINIVKLKQVFWSKAEIDDEMSIILGKGGHFLLQNL